MAPPVQAPALVPPEAEVNRKPLLEMLQNHHPPTFEGSTDPFIAEQWMDVITSMLDFIKIEGTDRVTCARHMLREDARIRWAVTSQIRDVSTMSWEQFQKVFKQGYFSDMVRKSKRNEFVGSIQGKLTVAEYAQTFEGLA